MKKGLLILLLLFCPITFSYAGEADVVAVSFQNLGGRLYRFDVTLKHNDEGWNHYADKWEIVAPDGTILATRILFHPHADEQPFTRSLPEVKIPKNITEVTVRAHESVHEFGGEVIKVKLIPTKKILK